jgi:hypothetical protein
VNVKSFVRLNNNSSCKSHSFFTQVLKIVFYSVCQHRNRVNVELETDSRICRAFDKLSENGTNVLFRGQSRVSFLCIEMTKAGNATFPNSTDTVLRGPLKVLSVWLRLL